MATRSVFAARKRRGPIEPRAGASWAHYFRLKALWPPELSLLHVAAPGRACWIRPELAGREQINSWRDAGCLEKPEAIGFPLDYRDQIGGYGARKLRIELWVPVGRGLARPDSGNLSAEDWAIMREMVEAVKRAIPDASSQPPGAVLQYAKNVAGLV